jgi:hypothetical protein
LFVYDEDAELNNMDEVKQLLLLMINERMNVVRVIAMGEIYVEMENVLD